MPNPSLVVPWSITGILFLVLILVFLSPDKAQIWSSWIMGWFASTHSFFDRKAASGKIQGTINEFSKELDSEGSGIMPYKLKVDWVKEVDRDAFLKEEGIVVVRVSYKRGNIEKSLVSAMLHFCDKALIPLARPYLSKDLLRSIDLVTTKKMLTRVKSVGSIDYFLSEVLGPEIQSNKQLCTQCQTMETLDERGLFSRVFLKELQGFGRRVYPKTPDGSTVSEADDFASFLKQIAEKAPDEDVELSFQRNNIKIGILLVARREVISELGYPPYLKRIERNKRAGIEKVYLCGLGANTFAGKQIAAIAEKQRLGKIISCDNHRMLSRKGDTVPAVCIAFSLVAD